MGRLHLPSALSAMSNRLRSVPSVVGLKLAFPRIVTMHDPFPSAMSTRRRCRSGDTNLCRCGSLQRSTLVAGETHARRRPQCQLLRTSRQQRRPAQKGKPAQRVAAPYQPSSYPCMGTGFTPLRSCPLKTGLLHTTFVCWPQGVPAV